MPTLATDVLRPRNAKYPIGTRFTLPTDEVDCDGFDAERTTPAGAVWAITGANTGANCHSYACECAATNGFIFLNEQEFDDPKTGVKLVQVTGEDRIREVVDRVARKYPEAKVALVKELSPSSGRLEGHRVMWSAGDASGDTWNAGRMYTTPWYGAGHLDALAASLVAEPWNLDQLVRKALMDAGLRQHEAVFEVPAVLGQAVVTELLDEWLTQGDSAIGLPRPLCGYLHVGRVGDAMRLGVSDTDRDAVRYALERRAKPLDAWIEDGEATDAYGIGVSQLWDAVCSRDAAKVEAVLTQFGPSPAFAGNGMLLLRAATDRAAGVTQLLLKAGCGVGPDVIVRSHERTVTRGFASRQLAAEFVANELQGCGDVAVLMDRRAVWPTEVLAYIERAGDEAGVDELPAPGM